MRRRVGAPRFLGNAQIFMVCVILVLSFLVFNKCSVSVPLTAAQRASQALSVEEQRLKMLNAEKSRAQRAPFDFAVYILSRLAVLALVVGASAGLITTLTLYGWRKAATLAPVGGLFPLVISKVNGAWTVFDANRAAGATVKLGTGEVMCSPGWEQAQLLTTAGALHVQSEQARSYNENVTLHDKRTLGSTGEDTTQAPIVWPKSVGLADLLQKQGGASLDKIILGLTPGDSGEWEVLSASMERMVHLGIGAASGYGKSTLLHAIIAQFVLAGNVELAMADAEGSTLGAWRNCDLLKWPMADEPDLVAPLFHAMDTELDSRARLFKQANNPENLTAYNKVRGDSPALLPMALIADEANSLLKDDAQAAQAAKNVAYRGRKFGLWLLLSGTRWTAREIPAGVKNQLSTRIGFKMNGAAQSNNLLLCADAAHLADDAPGVGIAIIPGRGKCQFKAPVVSRQEIEALLTGQSGPSNSAPVIDVEPVKVKVTPTAKLSANQETYALELAEDGLSTTAILKELFGPSGKSGPRAKAINTLLGRV